MRGVNMSSGIALLGKVSHLRMLFTIKINVDQAAGETALKVVRFGKDCKLVISHLYAHNNDSKILYLYRA